MVHHIRAESNEFVATQDGKEDEEEHGEKDNKEHMFAFVEGLATHEIGQLADLIHRWQDVVKDHCMENRSCVCVTYESLISAPSIHKTQTAHSTQFYSEIQEMLTLRSFSEEKCGNNFEAIYCRSPISIRLYNLEENQRNGRGIERL